MQAKALLAAERRVCEPYCDLDVVHRKLQAFTGRIFRKNRLVEYCGFFATDAGKIRKHETARKRGRKYEL